MNIKNVLKIFTFLLILLLKSTCSFAQARDTVNLKQDKRFFDFLGDFQVPKPSIYYYGLDAESEKVFKKNIGKKFRFIQHCDKRIDSNIVNGEVIFEKIKIDFINCYESLLIKDTVLVSQTLLIRGKRKVKFFMEDKTIPLIKENDITFGKHGYIRYGSVVYTDKKTGIKNKVYYQVIYSPRKLVLIASSEKLFE